MLGLDKSQIRLEVALLLRGLGAAFVLALLHQLHYHRIYLYLKAHQKGVGIRFIVLVLSRVMMAQLVTLAEFEPVIEKLIQASTRALILVTS